MLLDKNRNGTTCFSKFSFTAMVCMLAALLMLCSKLSVVAVTDESGEKIAQATGQDDATETARPAMTSAEMQALLDQLATALNNESEQVRLNVIEVLSELREQATAVLLGALNDESNVVRDRVVNALGEIGEDLAEDGADVTTITTALAKALNDPSEIGPRQRR